MDPIRDGMNWYVYTGNDPVNFIDPFGLFSTKDFILGTLQVIGGVFEVGVSYATGVAAEAASVGLLSVPVAILVTAGTLDGLRSLVEGITKITTSFDDDKDPISIPQEITGSIAESFGASEETIEKVKNITDAAETVGELLMPGKAVIQGVFYTYR